MIFQSSYATHHDPDALALTPKNNTICGLYHRSLPGRYVERRISTRAYDQPLGKRDPARRACTSCDAEGCDALGRVERGGYRAVYGGAADDVAEFAAACDGRSDFRGHCLIVTSVADANIQLSRIHEYIYIFACECFVMTFLTIARFAFRAPTPPLSLSPVHLDVYCFPHSLLFIKMSRNKCL
jgi:hypothetical protein